MYLYFSDWSQFLPTLDDKGIPHGGKIIKVYSSPVDPREILATPRLRVVEENGSPFGQTEQYVYPGRETYTGPALEDYLTSFGLTEEAKNNSRALFRFANDPEREFCQLAMAAKRDRKWFIAHPFEDLDGVAEAGQQPESRSMRIHLDIFYPRSLQRLQKVVDLNDPEQLMPFRETSKFTKLIQKEKEL